MSSKATIHWIGLSCSLLATLLYLTTLNGKLMFDDRVAIVDNSDMRLHSAWSNLLWKDFWGYRITDNTSHKSYRPLCSAMFKANYHLHELKPFGYHVVNVAINSIVCYLFVLVCGCVFERQAWTTALSGLLFTVHPIHTEAVSNVVGRAELMCAAFFLLALLVHHRVAVGKGKLDKLVLLLCFCSFLSKEQGIMAGPACIVYEIFIVQKMDLQTIMTVVKKGRVPGRLKSLIHRALVYTLFSVILLTARLMLMQGPPSFSLSDQPGQRLPSPYRQLYYLYLVSVNARLLLFPSTLRHDYRFGYIPLLHSFTDYRLLLTVAFFASLLVFGFRVAIKSRTHSHSRAMFSLSLMILFFLPSSNLFVTVGFVVAERVLFIPSMGACLLVGLGVSCLLNSKYSLPRYMTRCGVCLLLISHSVKTIHRSTIWNSGLNLYVEALKLYSKDPLMLSNLAYGFELNNDTLMSEQLQLQAISLGPKFVQPYRNYGALLQRQGRYQEAETMLSKAVELSGPTLKKYEMMPETYKSLAEVISKDKTRNLDSLIVMEKLVALAPSLPMAHLERGRYLLKLNRSKEADFSLQRALQTQLTKDTAFLEIGKVYLGEGFVEKAAHSFREGLALYPRNGDLMLELGCVLASNKSANIEDVNLSIRYLKTVIAADPSINKAYFHLGVIYVRLSKFQVARSYFERTLELNPRHRSATILLGYVRYTLGDYQGSIDMLTALPVEDIFDTTYTDIVALLGNSYLSIDSDDKAQELYYNVLHKEVENLSALNGLGALRMKQGSVAEAVTYFRKALQIDGGNERALNFLRQLNMNTLTLP